MAADEDFDEMTERYRRQKAERVAAAMAVFQLSPAVITTSRDGRKDLYILSGEMATPEQGAWRLTHLAEDGPYGHDVGRTINELAERMFFQSIKPATDADVIAWTTAPAFVEGSKRVAYIQAVNALSYRAQRAGRREVFVEAEKRASAKLEASDWEGATKDLEDAAKTLPEVNPPRVYRPQKIVATMQRDTRPEFPARGSVVTDPDSLMVGLADYLAPRAFEVFLVIFVNVRNQVIGYTEMTSGSISGVEVHPSGIFVPALTAGAAAIITVHNHPSGDPNPSPEDRALWARMREVGKLVGIPVLDNLVIGERDYYSEAQGAAPLPFARRKP